MIACTGDALICRCERCGDAGAYAVAVVRVVAGGAAADDVLGCLEVGEGAAVAASA